MPRDTTKVMGASNHSLEERAANDYYGTDPRSTRALLEVEKFDSEIWEPCAGHHLMVDELVNAGYIVRPTDLVDYGFGDTQINFLETDETWDGDIVTNPPYGLSTEFAVKALQVVKPGHKVAMFLRTLFLEGTKRYEKLFKENPPKIIYIFTNRQVCDANDNFNKGSAVSYMWVIWEKGFKGDPIVRWLTSKKE